MLPTRPASLATFTMLPLAEAIIGSRKARETRIVPIRLMSMTFSMNSGVLFKKGSWMSQPATFASTSALSARACNAAAKVLTESPSARSSL